MLGLAFDILLSGVKAKFGLNGLKLLDLITGEYSGLLVEIENHSMFLKRKAISELTGSPNPPTGKQNEKCPSNQFVPSCDCGSGYFLRREHLCPQISFSTEISI